MKVIYNEIQATVCLRDIGLGNSFVLPDDLDSEDSEEGYEDPPVYTVIKIKEKSVRKSAKSKGANITLPKDKTLIPVVCQNSGMVSFFTLTLIVVQVKAVLTVGYKQER